MKTLSVLVLLLCLAARAFAAPETIRLAGEITNTTGEVTAPATLVITIDGEKISGELLTSPPLSGSGKLTGRFIGGWCELHGKLSEGITIQFRGVLNPRDFRGTYIAAVPNALIQYGKFQLAREATAPAAPKK
jgi:hypothetical protein